MTDTAEIVVSQTRRPKPSDHVAALTERLRYLEDLGGRISNRQRAERAAIRYWLPHLEEEAARRELVHDEYVLDRGRRVGDMSLANRGDRR